MSISATNFARWYATGPAGVKVIVSALYWFSLLYSGAVVEKIVQSNTTDLGTPETGKAVYLLMLAAAVGLLSAIHYVWRDLIAASQREDEARSESMLYAASLIDQSVSERTAQFALAATHARGNRDRDSLLLAFTGSLQDLQRTT